MSIARELQCKNNAFVSRKYSTNTKSREYVFAYLFRSVSGPTSGVFRGSSPSLVVRGDGELATPSGMSIIAR